MNFVMVEPYILRCKYYKSKRISDICGCPNYCEYTTGIGCLFNLRSFNDIGEIMIRRIKNKDKKWAVQHLQSNNVLTKIVAGVIVNEVQNR